MPRTRSPFRVISCGFLKPLTGVFAAAGLFAAAMVLPGINAHAGNTLLMQHVAGDMKSGKRGGMRELRPRKDGYQNSHGDYGGRRGGSSDMAKYDDGGGYGGDGSYRKGGGKGNGDRNFLRNSNRNTNVNNNINTNRNVNTNTNVNTAVNRNNITIENNILLGERRSGVRYVGGGKHRSVRYAGGVRRVSSTHTVSSRRMAKSKVGSYRLRGSTVMHGRRGGGGGFHNSGMIVVSINNHSNNSGMSEVAGSSVTQSNVSDCAYGTYCTINLGGPKIITYNDVADIEDGAFTGHDDVPEDDLRYAK